METTLYPPVKRHLEGLGFEVKGEVRGCDLVGVKAGEPVRVVIGELKTSFTLDLVLQAVERTVACDEVWVAVEASKRGKGRENDRRVKRLCRMLGLGLLVVFEAGHVEVVVEPLAWTPRSDRKRRSRLVAEHRERAGDPTRGGSTRTPIMTFYRQQALKCAAALADGPRKMREVTALVPEAPKILGRDVYGWFERHERGVYGLSGKGRAAIAAG